MNSSGAASVAPADGTLLWKHEWKTDGIVQPAVIDGGDVLIGSGSGGAEVGMRRLAPHIVLRTDAPRMERRGTLDDDRAEAVLQRFRSAQGPCLRLRRQHPFLRSISTDGKRKWKGGRYGQGQMILIADQDLLLVLSEEGELALVVRDAGRVHASSRGSRRSKARPGIIQCSSATCLLVRNGEEMAAFRLATAIANRG